LPPPGAWGCIRLDRFSPNFDSAAALGFKDVTPYPSYSYLYPFAPEVVSNLAYFFVFQYDTAQDVTAYTVPLAKQLRLWKDSYSESDLFWVDKGDHVLIFDLRPAARHPVIVLRDVGQFVYKACDSIQSGREVCRNVRSQNRWAVSEREVQEVLEHFVTQGLMASEGTEFLSLALRLGEYQPSDVVVEKLHRVLQALDDESGSGDEVVVPLGTYSLVREVTPMVQTLSS
jgi:hypothetical protein